MNLDPDGLIQSITGSGILGGDIGDGGFHLYLDDGRIVVFTGMFVIGVLSAEERVLQ